MSQHVRPDWVLGVGFLGDYPETLFGVVNHSNSLAADGCDGPGFAQEVQGIVGVEFALMVDGQVEIQERYSGDGPMMVALFFEGQIPGGVGGQSGGPTDLVLVVPEDLSLEQGIGVFEVGNFFVGQQSDEAFLKRIEAAFDFTFGLGIGCHAMSHVHGGEGALELGVGVEAVGGGAVAEEGQAVGVEAGGGTVLFDTGAQMGEVTPGGVALGEGGGEDFAGVIVQSEDEGGVRVGGPPRMGGGIVLPEFTNGGALPSAPGFGAAFGRGQGLGEVLADEGGDSGTGAAEIETAGQFVGHESKIQRLAVRQEVGQEREGVGGPVGMVVAAGGLKGPGILVGEPLVTQFVEPGAANHQAFGGCSGIELTGVEGSEDLLDVEGLETVSELFLFIGARR